MVVPMPVVMTTAMLMRMGKAMVETTAMVVMMGMAAMMAVMGQISECCGRQPNVASTQKNIQ